MEGRIKEEGDGCLIYLCMDSGEQLELGLWRQGCG